MISFDQIPANLLTPGAYSELDISQLNNGQDTLPYRVVMFGYKTSAGSKANNTLSQVSTPSQAITYFGRGSMLARMCEKYLLNNTTVELFAVPVAVDTSGSPAAGTGTIVFSGTTTAGVVPLYIAGQYVPVTVSAGQATTSIATAVAAAINANLDLPVTAAASSSTVTWTNRHVGTHGDATVVTIGYHQGEANPSGLTTVITNLEDGVGAFDVTAALAAVGDENFSAFVLGCSDTSTATLETSLAARSGAMRQLDGLGYVGWSGTFSAMQTLGNARNSEFTVPLGLGGCPAPDWERAAATVGAMYTEIAKDPARHFEGLVVKGILPPPPASRLERQERQYLLEAGVSTYTVDRAGNLLIECVVTTRKTDTAGVKLPGLKLVNAMLILFYMRASWNRWIRVKYPRHKLAGDGTRFGTGQPVITPKIAQAEALAIGRDWETRGILEDYAAFKAGVKVERDSANLNQLNMVLPPNIINQFLVMATKIQPRA